MDPLHNHRRVLLKGFHNMMVGYYAIQPGHILPKILTVIQSLFNFTTHFFF